MWPIPNRQRLPHLSDEELLLAAEREASPRQLARARAHLAQCPDCRRRLTGLEGTLASFLSLHESGIPSQASLSSAARTALRSRLSESSRPGSDGPSWFSTTFQPRQWASACLVLLMVAGSLWAMRNLALGKLDTAGPMASALPRRVLTPGVAHAVAIEDLCVARAIDNDPPVDPLVQQAVFKEYGLQSSTSPEYRIDFLITPALGGAEDIQNLWPQPDSSPWNSRAKDQLENHLHELVCQGKVQLTTAQNDIATDWISAYKRYFNTERPILNTASARSHHRRPSYPPGISAVACARAPRPSVSRLD